MATAHPVNALIRRRADGDDARFCAVAMQVVAPIADSTPAHGDEP